MVHTTPVALGEHPLPMWVGAGALLGGRAAASGRRERSAPAWGHPPAPRELAAVVWHRCGARCHLQMVTPGSQPASLHSCPSPPATSACPEGWCRLRGRRGAAWGWGWGQSGDTPQPSPSTAGAAQGRVTLLTALVAHQKKDLFLAQGSCPTVRRGSWGESRCLTFKGRCLERWREQKSLKDYLFLMNYI